VEGQLPVDVSPRDRDAALRQSRQQEMLAELFRLEREGRGRGTAMRLARVNRQREELELQWKAAAFVRWHEPDDARVSSPDL
jgi:hypothetical protein